MRACWIVAVVLVGCSRSSLWDDLRDVGDPGFETSAPEVAACVDGSLGASGPEPVTDVPLQPADVALGPGVLWAAEWPFLASVARVALDTGEVEVVDEDRPNPTAIVADGSRAFWIDTGFDCSRGTLSRVDANGRVRRLAQELERPKGLLVDDRFVYVGDGPEGPCRESGSVLRYRHDGSGRTVLARGLSTVRALVAKNERVYWVESSGRLASVPTEGGTVETLAADLDAPRRLRFHRGFFYYATRASIGRVSVDGGDLEVLLDDGCVEAMTVDDDGVFFTCRDFNDPAAPGLFHLAVPSGEVTRLHTGSDNLTDVETDGVRLYWVDLADRDFNVWAACKRVLGIAPVESLRRR